MMPPPPLPPEEGPTDRNFGRPEVNTFTVVMNVVTTVTHILLGAVAFSAFFFTNLFNGSTHLTQHIYLCVIGYVILMSEAILTLSPYNGWANSLKYPNKKTIHWIMQVAGSALALVGSIIRIANVSNHFQTAHGITGLIAMILTVISLVGGAVKLIFPTRFSSLIHRFLHACFGILTVVIAFISLCFGFDRLYRNTMGDVNANLSIALTVIALIGSLASASINMIRRLLRY